jgi:hypothetical protein
MKERERELKLARRRWDDNIETGVNEITWEGVNWGYLAQVTDKWGGLL